MIFLGKITFFCIVTGSEYILYFVLQHFLLWFMSQFSTMTMCNRVQLLQWYFTQPFLHHFLIVFFIIKFFFLVFFIFFFNSSIALELSNHPQKQFLPMSFSHWCILNKWQQRELAGAKTAAIMSSDEKDRKKNRKTRKRHEWLDIKHINLPKHRKRKGKWLSQPLS